MKFLARIDIMPHKELLDPQGKTVSKNLRYVDIDHVHDVRIGKHVEMVFDASDRDEASRKVEQACKKLLANVITETYLYEVDLIE